MIKNLNIKKFAVIILSAMCVISCKKSSTDTGGYPPSGGGGTTNPVKIDSTYSPVDPALPITAGFFLDGFTGKIFTSVEGITGAVPTAAPTDSLTINLNKVLAKVPTLIYGNNSNLWSGQMVTQPNLMQYITDLSPNIIRAPAGSISDIYFFDGTDAMHAPADAPAQILNASGTAGAAGYWYGGNTASWTFSLDNYYKLLTQSNSTGLVTVNYGYARYGTSANPVAAAAHLAANWVRYDKGRTKYWEIGNETYGNWEAGYRIDLSKNKDGQPEYVNGALYGKHVTVFVDSMKAAAKEINATIFIGASLYQEPPYGGAYTSIQTWNQGVLTSGGTSADFYIVHNYFTAYNANSSVADILKTSNVPSAVMKYLQQQTTAAGAAMKPVALTEWNIQAMGSKQNVSFIAGIHAAKTLGEIIKNNYGEASRWDFANGYDNGDDMGLFNNGSESGAPLWNPRPAFYYMYYFQKYFGDRMVADSLKAAYNNSDITTYSSTFTSGQAGTIIVNSGASNHIVSIDFQHFPAGSKYYWYVLTGGTDNGGFSGQVFVNGNGPASPTGGPLNYATIKPYSAPLAGTIKINVPSMSVIYLVADKK